MQEIWKTYPPNPEYEVSSLGRVRSWAPRGPRTPQNSRAKTPRGLTPQPDRTGHLYVKLGRGDVTFVHTMVLEAFVGPCPGERYSITNHYGLECRHLDGDPSNNRPENLAWGTRSENRVDQVAHGTSMRGRNNKLTGQQVLDIFNSRASQEELAAQHGVNQSTVCRIRTGKRWAWLTSKEQ